MGQTPLAAIYVLSPVNQLPDRAVASRTRLSAVSATMSLVTHMKVGISEAVNTVLAIWMAEAAGLYKAENIEVPASHIGMGVNPLALVAVADRLAQDPDDWRPFDHRRGIRRWLFGG